jgi:hypothetical protein
VTFFFPKNYPCYLTNDHFLSKKLPNTKGIVAHLPNANFTRPKINVLGNSDIYGIKNGRMHHV